MRMKSIFPLVTLSLAGVLSTPARASFVVGRTGTVISIAFGQNSQYASVQISNASGTVPSCQTGGQTTLGTYGFDLSTNQGKALLSALEGAQLAGKTVGLGGGPDCTPATGGYETLGLITFYN